MRAVVPLLAVALLVGCGGSDDSGRTVTVTQTVASEPEVTPAPTPSPEALLTKAEYVTRADRLCADAKRQGATLTRRAGRVGRTDPRAFETLRSVYEELAALHRTWRGDLRALAAGRQAEESAAALLGNVTARLVLLSRIAEAFARHDATTAEVLLKDLYRLLGRGGEIGARHGFTVCGSATVASIAG